MRHRKDHRKLSRTASHRRAVLRNLVTSLFQYERIETTVAKAKEARRLAERLITFGKRGDVAARRHVDRFIMRPDEGWRRCRPGAQAHPDGRQDRLILSTTTTTNGRGRSGSRPFARMEADATGVRPTTHEGAA